VVNQLARQLLHVDHPNSEEIVSRQNQLNSKWSLLREKSELKREELISAHGVQVHHSRVYTGIEARPLGRFLDPDLHLIRDSMAKLFICV
jgi:hypothetical protein